VRSEEDVRVRVSNCIEEKIPKPLGITQVGMSTRWFRAPGLMPYIGMSLLSTKHPASSRAVPTSRKPRNKSSST
jgi:hypothetical protein